MNTTKQNTFPCNCGHEAKLHERVDAGIGEEWCNGLTYYDHDFNVCQCSKYVPDNLKYLEEQYNQKVKRG